MNLTLFSANIFTNDPDRPRAEALAIRGNRIVAVGENEAVKAAAGKLKGKVLELPGRLVTPGLVDGHCHFGTLGRSLRMVDLSGCTSLAACRQKITQAVKTTRPGQWLLGKGWNQHQWEEGRNPSAEDIDDLTPENPAMMTRACGHTVWVNSPALAMAGITKKTPNPPGGKIERHPGTGRPTGLLQDARELIDRVMPRPSPEEWKAAMLAAQEMALASGITGVHSFEGLKQWQALKEIEEEGLLKIRVHHGLPAAQLDRIAESCLQPGQGSSRLWPGHIKLFADGSLGAGTALLHHPYTDNPAGTGIEVTSEDEMAVQVIQAYETGFDVAVHAIGDRAVTQALNAIARGRNATAGNRPHRDRVEHVQLCRVQDLALFKKLGVCASVQPVFLPTDWQVAEDKWGKARTREGGYAWKTIADAGIPMMFGSDAPVEPIAPLLGLHTAVTRQTLSGIPAGGWHPEQQLSLEQAITGYTRLPAWSAGKVDCLGIIKPGFLADLTIFEQNLFHVPPAKWSEVNVEMTIVDGEIAYSRTV